MAVRVFEGKGEDACPQGWYALYENHWYNDDKSGRVLVSDQPVADLRGYDFTDITSSVVNQCALTVVVCSKYDGEGFGEFIRRASSEGDLRRTTTGAVRNVSAVGNGGHTLTNMDNETCSVRFRVDHMTNDKNVVQPLPGGVYTLTNVGSGKALDLLGPEGKAGANVGQNTAHGGTGQRWRLTPVTADEVFTGEYEITSEAGGKILDVSGRKVANGTNVQVWDYSGFYTQRWWLTPAGDGVFVVSSRHSGKALDVHGASTSDGANVQIWECNGTDAQNWRIQPA
ncbi:RICIN domain-containing protein [Kitasatospora sp. NPDC088779]|uniref:RICIN domain-containing protein n=1 Tax=Kitasatospora sp. NPDC088779 TaxID=3154964 RepID=UPI00342704B2